VAGWYATSSRGRSWDMAQNLSAGPATAADRKVWRREGAPTSWNMCVGCNGPGNIVTAGPGPTIGFPSHGGTINYFMTLDQIRRLPASPAQLKSVLLKPIENSVMPAPGPLGGGSRQSMIDEQLIASATALLESPATAPVLAATYRMLAQLPEVASVGLIRDPLGRLGNGVVFDEMGSSGKGPTAELVVIKPGTGTLLAWEQVEAGTAATPAAVRRAVEEGRLFRTTAVLAARWTDAVAPRPQVVTNPNQHARKS
jgi:hypothetical protein